MAHTFPDQPNLKFIYCKKCDKEIEEGYYKEGHDCWREYI